MTINVQCVYGDDDIENVRNCIIPNLAAATKEKVVFLTMNYDAAGKRLDSGDQYGCEVRDIPKPLIVVLALPRITTFSLKSLKKLRVLC